MDSQSLPGGRSLSGGRCSEIPRTARVHIAGHRGLVGSALVRHFTREGFRDLLLRSPAVTDLRDRDSVRRLYAEHRPRIVVLAAARTGGLAASRTRPVDFLSDDLRIQLNVLDAACEFGVERLLLLGSSCCYPRHAPQPIPETALFSGALDPVTEPYAMAKLAGIAQLRAIRGQYGLPYIAALPSHVYGPGDRLDPRASHALGAMLGRTHEAHTRRASRITHWGSAAARREFLHVDDLARACLFLLERYDGEAPVNVGAGHDIELRELASLIAHVVGYRGEIGWDDARPDGSARELLDTTRLTTLGFKPEISLPEGLRRTYTWLRTTRAAPVAPAASAAPAPTPAP